MMGARLFRFASFALILCALLCVATAPPAGAYVTNLGDRWEFTATNGDTDAWGTPVTVTWSFAPENTQIPGAPSNLISFLNTNFGDYGSIYADPVTGFQTAPWFNHFNQSFGRLSAVSGITYVYEPHDDGLAFNSGFAGRGILGTRGDIRIGARPYPVLDPGGPNERPDPTLAANYLPDNSEMMINTNQLGYLGNPENGYRRLRNVLMHEGMHGLGVSHVYTETYVKLLMTTMLYTTFEGPQLDDVLALHRLYGDVLEKSGGNDAAGSATSLGSLAASQSLVRGTLGDSVSVATSAVDFVSIDDASDSDFFSFTLANPLSVSLALTPKGATYPMSAISMSAGAYPSYDAKAQSDLSLALFDSSGTTQIGATANVNGLGLGESIVRELNAGTYYARVTGAQNTTQLYQLAVSGVALSADQLTWVGASGGVWNLASTANFHNGASADVFRNGDSVTFGNGAATTLVTISTAVAPAAMTIQASGNYNFTGSGGITVSGLIVDGGGAATLANSGNNLNGVDVRAGSLTISGAGNNLLAGTIRVAAGASLGLAGQSFAAASQLSGRGTVTGNVTTPGAISPGDGVGTLTFANNLSLTSSSALTIQLGGLSAGTQYDVLVVGGQASLGGLLSVMLTGGFQPPSGAEFAILTAGSRLGVFATQTLPSLSGGLVWQTMYTATGVTLSVSSGVSYDPADFNEDGHVDGDDLTAWRLGFGTLAGATHSQGDANGDQMVNGDDFLIWQRRLNAPPLVAPNSTQSPEPGTWSMALAAMAAVAGRVRRGRSPRRV